MAATRSRKLNMWHLEVVYDRLDMPFVVRNPVQLDQLGIRIDNGEADCYAVSLRRIERRVVTDVDAFVRELRLW